MGAEIRKEDWVKFLEILSKRRFEWKTKIEILSTELGDQILSNNLPLNGITLENKGGATTMDISVRANTKSHQTHSIKNPSRIAFLTADNSHGDIVDVEQEDGTKTLIHFKEPMGLLIGFKVAMAAAAAA
jgi:hypothetical protein